MHDAVTVEKAGVAATAIITDRFAATAQAMARLWGVPEFPFAIVGHPIANNEEAALRMKAAEAARQCAAILLERT